MPAASWSSAIAGERPSMRISCKVIAIVGGMNSPSATAAVANPASFSVWWCWNQAASASAV
jgi:hypothetical protein